MFKKIIEIGLILGAIFAFQAQAEDRALLIGVGKYQQPGIDLPGIDLDINMMKKAAELMGYATTKVILNEQATLNNVVRTMEDYLIDGVKADDRVLIYYSGHGTYIPDTNGDENEDGADEVLTMHDMKPVKINGKRSLEHVLIDDKFNLILKQIPSNNILVLIDACNSGTATKSLNLTSSILGDNIETHIKAFQYEGMPMFTKGAFVTKPQQENNHYVAISAAGDDESSIATPKGSLFTLGLVNALNKSAKNQAKLTPAQLKDSIAGYIKTENKSNRPFTPRLSGAQALANEAIALHSANDGQGQVWQSLIELTKQADPLEVQINQSNYVDGDTLKITINNTQPGYLNVINVGPDDQPTILFPNQYNLDAKVQGSVTIPTPEMQFELAAQAPFGQALIIAFLSSKPLNLYKNGDASRDDAGNIDNLFHSLSELGLQSLTRSFVVRQKSDWVKAGKVITRICESSC